jgi:hypothetical protein
MHTA